MSQRNGLDGSPPRWRPDVDPSPDPRASPISTDGPRLLDSGHAYLMLGELIGQGRHIMWRLGVMDERLTDGARRFEDHGRRLTALETMRMQGEMVPRWERIAKRWAAVVSPLIAFAVSLWATGSIDAAVRVVQGWPK